MATEAVQMSADPQQYNNALSTAWWLVLLHGILLILLGLFAIADPAQMAVVFVTVMAIFILVDSIFGIVASIMGRSWWLLLIAILGIIVSVIVLAHPIISTLIAVNLLILIIAIQAIINGLTGIFAGFRADSGKFWYILLGLVGVVLGGFLLAVFFGVAGPIPDAPGANTLALNIAFVQVLGIFGIAGGIVSIITAFQIRRNRN